MPHCSGYQRCLDAFWHTSYTTRSGTERADER